LADRPAATESPDAGAGGRPAPIVRGFFDEPTNTVSYLVVDPETRSAAVIDPLLDFDQASGTIATRSAEAILAAAEAEGCKIELVLETHVHADHLTAAQFIKARTGARLGIGSRVTEVQRRFAAWFGADDVAPDDFDLLFDDGDRLPLGGATIEVIDTPGHTPACVSYLVGDALFVGDTLFMPDYGTARTDFPGGDARQLYRSIRRLRSLPAETRMFLCHDYKAPGRCDYCWETTVGEQAVNLHVGGDIDEEAFVALRCERDKALATPQLLLPSIQVNIRGGRLPPPGPDGVRRLVIPLSLEGASELP
jgi:glyoxylase-like metal-dependent hydrolase (beta-lactamase superfamily II)